MQGLRVHTVDTHCFRAVSEEKSGSRARDMETWSHRWSPSDQVEGPAGNQHWSRLRGGAAPRYHRTNMPRGLRLANLIPVLRTGSSDATVHYRTSDERKLPVRAGQVSVGHQNGVAAHRASRAGSLPHSGAERPTARKENLFKAVTATVTKN